MCAYASTASISFTQNQTALDTWCSSPQEASTPPFSQKESHFAVAATSQSKCFCAHKTSEKEYASFKQRWHANTGSSFKRLVLLTYKPQPIEASLALTKFHAKSCALEVVSLDSPKTKACRLFETTRIQTATTCADRCDDLYTCNSVI